jgi:hypothetical protein
MANGRDGWRRGARGRRSAAGAPCLCPAGRRPCARGPRSRPHGGARFAPQIRGGHAYGPTVGESRSRGTYARRATIMGWLCDGPGLSRIAIYFVIAPQAMRSPALPDGSDVISSAFA